MQPVYGRDLDLNLLRVFAVVAHAGSVTQAAAQLYLTQPAVSAALRRLANTVGAALFAKQGRNLVLTARGRQLLAHTERHLQALVDAALDPDHFDPKTSDRTLRIGLSDDSETWLLPLLLRQLAQVAPQLRLCVIPVQFRTVGAALSSGQISLAVTVADELPANIQREPLYSGSFVCLFDPRHAKLTTKLSLDQYFAHDHVIVSYNGDLRGIVEDMLHRQRRVRCSVAGFSNLGALIEGTALLATVPDQVAKALLRERPTLRTLALPFALAGVPVEMHWPASLTDDEAITFLRHQLKQAAQSNKQKLKRQPPLPS
ncbi:MAG: hypothetical protein RL701_2927 [Pseudomonadota bacterium]